MSQQNSGQQDQQQVRIDMRQGPVECNYIQQQVVQHSLYKSSTDLHCTSSNQVSKDRSNTEHRHFTRLLSASDDIDSCQPPPSISKSISSINKSVSSSEFLTIQLFHLGHSIYKQPSLQEDISDQRSSVSQGRFSHRGLSLIEENNQFLQTVEFTSFQHWLLLILSAICNAVVPCWMTVDIKCEGMTRSAWRGFTLSLLLIPFVMSQQRWSKNEEESFFNLLKLQRLKKIYISSLNFCVWVLFGVFSGKFTARSHSFCFLRLKFFFIAISKLYNKRQCHQGEIGGVFLVIIGLAMMIWDSLSLPVIQTPNIYYLQCSWWERLLGDVVAIAGCLVLLRLETIYQFPKGPRFSTLLIYNLCISVNLIAFGYFFGGNEFSFDPKRGVFGLFTSHNFVGIFYVSIMLGLNLIIANVLVNQIFSPFIRNLASCFQIVITTAVYHIFSIEELYSGMTSLGFCFLVPGMMMIVGGQGALQKLQLRINSEIYTSERVVLGNNKTAQIILKSKVSINNNSMKQDQPISNNLINQDSILKSIKEADSLSDENDPDNSKSKKE